MLLVLLLVSVYGGHVSAEQSETVSLIDRGVHLHYVELAFEAYHSGDYDYAKLLLKQSSEFLPLSRDYYVLSSFLSRKDSDFKGELASIRKAFDVSGGFEHQFQNLELERRVYQLNYIMKRYVANVESYSEEDKNFPDQEKDFYYFLSLSTGYYVEDWKKIRENFLNIYANDVRFYLVSLGSDDFFDVYFPKLKWITNHAQDLESQGVQVRRLTAIERSVLLASIRRLKNMVLQRKVLESVFFWFKGDINYRNYVSTLGINLPDLVAKEIWEYLYFEKDFLTGDRFFEYVNTDNSRVGHDSNIDGIPDQYGFFNGLDGSWAYDNDQNGNSEYTVVFREGIIEGIVEIRGNKVLTWEFARYPYLKSVNVCEKVGDYDSGYRLFYHVFQGVMGLDFEFTKVLREDWEAVPLLLEQGNLPTLWEVLQKTNQIDEYHFGQHFRKVLLRNGSIYHVFEDSLGKGFFDRFLVINDWKVVYGLRKLTQKERFDIYEHYESGVFKGLAYFADDTENPSYYQDFKNGNEIKIWTFDKGRYVDIVNTEDDKKLLTYTEMIGSFQKITPQDFLQWNDVPDFVLPQL